MTNRLRRYLPERITAKQHVTRITRFAKSQIKEELDELCQTTSSRKIVGRLQNFMICNVQAKVKVFGRGQTC